MIINDHWKLMLLCPSCDEQLRVDVGILSASIDGGLFVHLCGIGLDRPQPPEIGDVGTPCCEAAGKLLEETTMIADIHAYRTQHPAASDCQVWLREQFGDAAPHLY
jgi:hypothetical protein